MERMKQSLGSGESTERPTARVRTAGPTVRPMAWRALLALVLAANAGLGARAAAGELAEVFALSDSYKLNREGTRIFSTQDLDLNALRKRNVVWDAGSKTVPLCGAKNETVAFQLFLCAGEGGAAEVNVSVGKLAGPGDLPADCVTLFKEWYIETKRASAEQCLPSAGTGWYPDALVPWDVKDHGAYDGAPFRVEARRAQGVWVDLHIPADAAAGEYSGTIEITAGGKAEASVALKLKVLRFAVPKEPHHVILMNGNPGDVWQAGGYWMGKDEARKDAFEDACYRMARRHRFTWGNMYFEPMNRPASLYPKITLGGDGSITAVDWTEYDKRFGKVLDPKANLFGPGEAPIEYWRLPMVTGIKAHKRFPATEKAWAEFPAWIRKHWEEKGWNLERTYVYLVDEPRPEHFDAIEKFAKYAKDGKLHAQVAVLPQPAGKQPQYVEQFYARFPGLFDRWLWSANSCDPARMHEKLGAGDWKGFYQGNEPYAGMAVLDKDGLDMRTWGWIAWQYKLDFSCYYCITEFSGEDEENRVEMKTNAIWTHPENRANGNQSKGVFMYPGSFVNDDRPIESIRMKEVRRGQQDYEYMWLLAQQGAREAADAGVKKILVKALSEAAPMNKPGTAGPWSRDPEAWDAVVRGWGSLLEAK